MRAGSPYCEPLFLPRCMECGRGLAMRKLSDSLSACLSVKRVNCDKTEERSVQIFKPYERSCSLVFWEEEWLVGATPSTWNFRSTAPGSEIARSSSAVTPSEKVQLNLIGSPLCAFKWAWDDHRTLPLCPPKGASETQNGRFSLKNALRLKKVCYKVSLCENCQRQSCKEFIGLTNRAKVIGGGRPLVPEILSQSDRVGGKFEQ